MKTFSLFMAVVLLILAILRVVEFAQGWPTHAFDHLLIAHMFFGAIPQWLRRAFE